jgi:hypothetical protein
MNMIERVARAICESNREDSDYLIDNKPQWVLYEPDARAAIQAMMEVTPAMRLAGEKEMMARHTNLDCFNDPYVDSTWSAMITAALEPTP